MLKISRTLIVAMLGKLIVAKRGKQGKLFSKLECMQEYHAALKTLLDRFDHATNEQEGKDDFRYDIKQIEHDMKVVFAAGWENVKDIMEASLESRASTMKATNLMHRVQCSAC